MSEEFIYKRKLQRACRLWTIQFMRYKELCELEDVGENLAKMKMRLKGR